LIVTDCFSCLQSLSSNIFYSSSSHLILSIRKLLLALNSMGFDIQFLWVLGHISISGNETTDILTKYIASIRLSHSNLIPWLDFCPN
jgi:hypothetical protein